MYGSPAKLPFLQILVPEGAQSSGAVNLETDRDLISVQLRMPCAASGRPILLSNKRLCDGNL